MGDRNLQLHTHVLLQVPCHQPGEQPVGRTARQKGLELRRLQGRR
jgi:hypothetical protein